MKLPFKQVYNFRPGGIEPFLPLKPTQTYYKTYRYLGWLFSLMKVIAPGYVIKLKDLAAAMIKRLIDRIFKKYSGDERHEVIGKSKVIKMKKAMYILLFILVLVSLTTILFMNQAQFGNAPSGERLNRIEHSSNFRNGQFQNLNFTPTFAEDVSKFEMIRDGIFKISKRKAPSVSLPSVKTNLFDLDPQKDLLVWFGHSSYFMRIDGKKILVDPVFSGSASPFSFMVKSFKGSDVYSPEEIPPIDYLIITHDHWDHLDYKTVVELKPKVGKIITRIGYRRSF